ncbi:trypsin [Marvinbryantia formatexigens DSM 14469]|uniref:Trypsin n=1 Tax=Marvinbryantia formatexigens DSM 14469 TaxID=478749 RepID=C6LFR0_9FIRM|nr:trypsin-like peptidase domain-containing protein [Marvinbryantia formatexigens]EET60645.1 trypsin [Marvinbryantia formatexigens DSM 14469]UWO25629.1 trypsin-like peptidase domain-containing protein [Marvinbryantia formatexigens DSM 14469]SDG16727.1 serine protease Do [Marvinbryantia formatexigens]
MSMKKKIGTCAAALAAVGALGATVYGIGNMESNQQEDRITLDAQADLAADTTLDSATAEAADIDEIPTQEESNAGGGLPDVQTVASDAMPAIVAITNVGIEEVDFFGRSYQQETTSGGSGIIVGKNDDELLIATNNHVVEGAEELTVCFSVDVEDDEDGEKTLAPALVKGTDSSMDLAVIAVSLDDIDEEVADKIGIIQLGDSDELQVGEWVVAIGNALGYGQSVTAGVVSALDREVSVSTDSGTVTNDMIQTDAAINFGNSGGALLDMNGRLVGINSAKAAVEGVEGMGYAIPINTAKPIIEDLMNQTTRTRVDEENAGALGITVMDIDDDTKELYHVPSGALVYELTDNSAAKEAGIETGDIITMLDETKISSRADLLNRMQYYEAGETVTVTLQRFEDNGYQEKQIEVKLGKKSDLQTSTSSDNSKSDNSGSDDSQEDDSYYYDSNDGNYGMQDFFRGFGF